MPTGIGEAIDLSGCGCTGCDGCTEDTDCPEGQICEFNGTDYQCTDPPCECCTYADNSVGCAQPGWGCKDTLDGWRCLDCSLARIEGCLGCGAGDPCYSGNCDHYDFDGDGDIDFTDLGTFRGYCCCPGIEECAC